MKFKCVDECSQCCIQREYYPSKEYGKIGVLVLPEEKARLERLASARGIAITILPRIGTSDENPDGPSEILAYQLMGKDADGDTCPFLDLESEKRSPHDGHTCMIYPDRPLACAAYPVIETEPLHLDEKCKFCKQYGQADQSLESEESALCRIKTGMKTDKKIWRYATGVGSPSDMKVIQKGWQRQY